MKIPAMAIVAGLLVGIGGRASGGPLSGPAVYGLVDCAGHDYGDGMPQGAEAFLVGDINGDGHVNAFDLLMLAQTFTRNFGEPGFNPEADFNCDQTINAIDLLMLASNWGI